MISSRFACLAPLAAFSLAACQPPAPEPTPAPSPPAAQPSAAPPVVITPTYDDWMDAPQTAGDWTYVDEGGETLAVYGKSRAPGDVQLIIRCDRSTRRVGIGRAGDASGSAQMLFRTETQDRTLTGAQVDAPSPLLVTELNARDSLLDAIAFSKGRFAVETPGAPAIFVPAWPEITRVIEDCRG